MHHTLFLFPLSQWADVRKRVIGFSIFWSYKCVSGRVQSESIIMLQKLPNNLKWGDIIKDISLNEVVIMSFSFACFVPTWAIKTRHALKIEMFAAVKLFKSRILTDWKGLLSQIQAERFFTPTVIDNFHFASYINATKLMWDWWLGSLKQEVCPVLSLWVRHCLMPL